MSRSILVVLFLAACSGPTQTSSAPPPPPPPPPPPATVPDAAVASTSDECVADSQHCCMEDGRLVVPGGCQPSYPDNVQPATERNDDGSCRSIPCYLKCLPAAARIDTPRGEVPVSELAPGDPVWTTDARGARVEGQVLFVRLVPVPADHQLVEVTLADGRVVRGSGEHPLAGNARGLGDLAAGDALDGSIVTAVRALPYHGAQTWDLLPSGPARTYWADGVLLGSTLR